MKTSENKTSDDNLVETSSDLPRSSRPGRLWRWLLLALLLVGGGVLAWRLLSPKKSEAPAAAEAQPQGTPVKLLEVQTATTQNSSEYLANLVSRRSVALQPRIEGQVSRIFVRAGDEIAAGTPIIEIDPREQQAAVSSTSAAAQAVLAEVENAKATLKSLEAERLSNLSQLQLSQRQYDRYSRLAGQGAVSREVRDQYADEFQTARSSLGVINQRIEAQKAAVAQAEKSVLEAQANTREQQVQLQYFQISAPFTGTVGDIPVKVGDFVNTSTRLTTVTENRPLEVNIRVPIEQAPDLRQGMSIELLNAQGKSVGNSRLFFIAPNMANDNTQTVLVKSLFENTRGQLRADQYVRARVIWNQRPGILIPTTAINRLGAETFVYVAQQQSQQGQSQLVARQKRVELGAIQGNDYQVLKGLQPGEKAIVSGILNLRDGAPVTPEK